MMQFHFNHNYFFWRFSKEIENKQKSLENQLTCYFPFVYSVQYTFEIKCEKEEDKARQR